MILPDNLAPFPTPPSSYTSDGSRSGAPGEFVSESSIRRLLIGPMAIVPPAGRRVPEGDGFAGREDLAAHQESPFAALSSDAAYEDAPAKPFLPDGPHPALQADRRAAPPRLRIEVERSCARRTGTDRWWILGVAVALIALISSGALVELVSRDAIRRAGLDSSDPLPPVPALQSAPLESATGPAIAATGDGVARH